MRIQIVNWRGAEDDESYCNIAVIPDTDDLLDHIEEEIEETDKDLWEREVKSEGYHFFINDDISIYDGEEMESPDGKKFRIRIEEIT